MHPSPPGNVREAAETAPSTYEPDPASERALMDTSYSSPATSSDLEVFGTTANERQ